MKCSKCSKQTIHLTGLCFQCRRVSCRICQKKFSPGGFKTDLCSECRARLKSNKGVHWDTKEVRHDA